MSFIYETIRISNRLDPTTNGRIITNSKGDIIVDNGTTTTTQSVGSNGQAFVADSSQSTGVKWKTLTASDISDFDTEVANNTDVITNTTHHSLSNNPHSVTKAQIGLTNVENLKVNLNATVNPTTTDDYGSGYSVGSRWINTSTDKEYVCADASSSAAVWVETTAAASAGELAFIAGSTYKTVQESHDLFNSTGLISGGDITDAGSETIDVTAGKGVIRSTNSSIDTLEFFNWSVSTGISIPTDSTRYVGVEYNSGSPQIVVKTTNSWDYNTDFPLGCIINEDTTIHIVDEKHAVGDHSSYTIQRFQNTDHFVKDQMIGGLTLEETGTRNITVSAGTIWSKLRVCTIGAIDTSDADAFETYYQDGVGGWTKQTSLTQWPNDKYDNGTGTLATIGNGKYSVLWFYLDINGNLLMMYNDQEFDTAAGAENDSSQPSSIPDRIDHISILLGRMIFQKGASTASVIQTIFGVSNILPTTMANHSNLNNLQGGTSGQFYHLTSTQHGYINGLGSNATGISDTQSLTNKTIDADANTITNIENADIKAGASIDATKVANGSVSNTEFQYLGSLTSAAVGLSDTQTLTNKTFTDSTTYFQDNTDTSKKLQLELSGITTSTTRTITVPDANMTLVGTTTTQTLTNKSINADNNTITNIDNADIKAGASINATKIADGSVTNTEFQYIGSLTSGAVGLTDTQTLTNKTLIDASTYFADDGDNTKKLQFQLSGISTSTTRTLTVPDANTTLVGTDTTQTVTNKSINADNNTITNIENADIKAAAAIDATKIADGSVSNTEFQRLNGIGSSAVGLTDAQTVTNKSLVDATTYIIDDSDNTKKVQFQVSGLTTATTRVLTVPDANITLVGTASTQTLTNKTFGDDLDMDSNKITNLAEPVADTDAATKKYVDTTAQGLSVKDSVRVKTVASLPTYTQSGSGVGATLTADANGALPSIDGVALSANDRFLVDTNGSTNDTHNGIYIVTQVGDGSNPWILTRATDADDTPDNEVQAGMYVLVTEGSTCADCSFILSTNDPITVDTTALSFTQFSGAGQITAGTGMTKSGNTLDVGGSSTVISNADDLEVNSSTTANQILLSSGSVGTAATYGALPLGNSNSVSGTLDIGNGGTNTTSFGAGSRIVATNSGNTALETTSLNPSTIVTDTGSQTLTNKTLTDSTTYFQDNLDTSKKLQLQLSGITTSTTRTLTVPNANTTLVGHDVSQTLTNKTIDADSNTITNIDNGDIKAGAGIDASKIANGSVSNTEFQYLGALTSSAVGLSDSQTLTNKTFTDSTTYFQDNTDTSKKAQFQLSGISTGTTRTFTLPDLNDALVTLTAAQTLTNKSIDADTNTITNIDNADIKVGAGINATKIANGSVSNTEFQYLGSLTSAAVGLTDAQTLTNKTFTDSTTYFQDNLDNSKKVQLELSGITTSTTRTITVPDADLTLVGTTITQSLTNKTIDADNNTITNIENADIKAGAAIDATKIGDGSISNAEFQKLNGITSLVVGISDTQILTNKTFTDNTTFFQDDVDNTKKLKFQLSGITSGQTRLLMIPDVNDTLVTLAATQTLTNKTIDANNNTVSNISNTQIKTGAAIDATKIADGSISNTEFQYLNGLTSTAIGLSDTQTLTNKTFTDNSTYFQDNSDNTKKLQFQLSGIATATTRTLTVPNANTILVGTDVTQTLTNKTIDAASNTITNIENADIKAGAAIDATKIANGSVSNTEFQRLNGIGSSVVGISDTQTLTNKTLTSPKVQTAINDINGNELIKLTSVVSAVNEITISNATAGNNPSITASGNDTNLNLAINPKGNGKLVLDGLNWPTDDGSVNQVIKTDGSNTLSFADVPVLTIDTVTTTSATETTISTIGTSSNTVYIVETHIAAKRTDAANEAAGYVLRSVFRNDSGTLTKVGEDKMSAEDVQEWDIDAAVSGTDIIISVVGQAAKTINWKASSRITTI